VTPFSENITEKRLTRAQQYLRWVTVATIDMGRKEDRGAAVPLLGRGRLGHCLTQCGMPRPTSVPSGIPDASSHYATTYMGQKLEGCAPFQGRGSWVPI